MQLHGGSEFDSKPQAGCTSVRVGSPQALRLASCRCRRCGCDSRYLSLALMLDSPARRCCCALACLTAQPRSSAPARPQASPAPPTPMPLTGPATQVEHMGMQATTILPTTTTRMVTATAACPVPPTAHPWWEGQEQVRRGPPPPLLYLAGWGLQGGCPDAHHPTPPKQRTSCWA